MKSLNFSFVLFAILAFAQTVVAEIPLPVNAAQNNIVRVTTGKWAGSGVYVGDGYVLTAKHVFRGQRGVSAKVVFRIDDEKITGKRVAIPGVDPAWDSVVIKLDQEPSRPLPDLFPSRNVGPGDMLYVAGYSAGELLYRGGKFTQFVSPARSRHLPAWYVEFAAPVYSGDSGGPVFLADGTLVGTAWGGTRTYTVALCAKHTRGIFGKLFEGRGRGRGGEGGDCGPDGACPNPGSDGERPIDLKPLAEWEKIPGRDYDPIPTIEYDELPGNENPRWSPASLREILAELEEIKSQPAFDISQLTDEQMGQLALQLSPAADQTLDDKALDAPEGDMHIRAHNVQDGWGWKELLVVGAFLLGVMYLALNRPRGVLPE